MEPQEHRKLGFVERKLRLMPTRASFGKEDKPSIEVVLVTHSDSKGEGSITFRFRESNRASWDKWADMLSNPELKSVWATLTAIGEYTDVEIMLLKRFSELLVARKIDANLDSPVIVTRTRP